jgi:hypothetical protein
VTRPIPTRALLALAVVFLAACASPPSHLTRLWPEGGTGEPILGLSTEDGVLVLAEPQWQVGDVFEIHFPVGNSLVRDWGRLDRRNDDLVIIRPITARLLEGRFATALPDRYEPLYLALRDLEDEPEMVEVERWHDLRHGNFIVPPEGDAMGLVTDWAGVGLYVQRGDRWEIIGMLADVTARLGSDGPSTAGAGFVGIGEISRLLPDQVDYFDHPIPPPRPDFEHGVPLQPGDIVLDPVDEDAAEGDAGDGR